MPDTSLKTISGTQISCLFDTNPYTTKWLLWRIFSGLDDQDFYDKAGDERMQWGLLLERAIFDETLRRLNVEGTYNENDEYIVHPDLPIGATPDGECFHPSRGVAVVQVKNVDWMQWADKWTDEQAPAHIELQLQHEMKARGAAWGVIAVLVGGNELRIYEREPDDELQADMIERVLAFFKSVEDGDEPDPLGMPCELPKVLQIERDETKIADLTDNEEIFDALQALSYYEPRVKAGTAEIKKAKAVIATKSAGAGRVIGHGYGCEIKTSSTPASTVELPRQIADKLLDIVTLDGIEATAPALYEAILAATNWQKTIRQASTRTIYKVYERPTDEPPSWLGGFDNMNILQG